MRTLMTDVDMKNNTTWSESPIHQKIKDAGLDTGANIHCPDQSGSRREMVKVSECVDFGCCPICGADEDTQCSDETGREYGSWMHPERIID